jgi:hypothetical protein
MKIGLTNIVSCKIGSTQVNRVYIGSTLIWSYSAFDPDAQLFITNAAITEPVQQNAVNNLVINLKNYGIWTKMKALYPFVGGTASQHKFNLKNPLDTNAAYRLTFSGGWTHNSNGISGNSINTTSSTFLAANSVLTAANGSLSVYCRNTINESGYDIAYNEFGIALYGSASYFMWGDGFPSVNRPATRGFYQLNRLLSITNAKFNTTTILTNSSVGAVNSSIISIGSNGSTASYSSRNYAFASIGNGLTDTEAANYYTAVQTIQTTLSRNE